MATARLRLVIFASAPKTGQRTGFANPAITDWLRWAMVALNLRPTVHRVVSLSGWLGGLGSVAAEMAPNTTPQIAAMRMSSTNGQVISVQRVAASRPQAGRWLGGPPPGPFQSGHEG